MRVDPIPLASKVSEGVSKPWTTEGLVNCYPEGASGVAKSPFLIKSFPGHRLFSTIGAKIRGQWAGERGHFVIAGEQLYRIDGAGASSALGLIDGSRLCDVQETNNSLAIVADTRTYLYNFVFGTLTELTDPDFPGASSAAFLNQRLIFTEPRSGRFFWTEVNEDGAIAPLDFATAEAETDELVAARNVNEALVLLGSYSVEYWAGTGEDGSAAFRRSTAAAPLSIGCISRDTIVEIGGTLYFLAQNKKPGGVMVSTLTDRISTHAIDSELEKAGDLSLARAHSFMIDGHIFYEITVPGHFSAVYDLSTREWVQTFRGIYAFGDRPQGDSGRVTMVTAGRKRIAGLTDGNLYEVTASANDNAGSPLIREVSTPPWMSDGRQKTIGRVELEIESGVGLLTGDDVIPNVDLCVSKDGGKTWQAPIRAGFGARGAYGTRCVWTRLGASRDWRFKFRVTGNVPVSFYEARAHYTDHGP